MNKLYLLLLIPALYLVSCSLSEPKQPTHMGDKPYNLTELDLNMNVPLFFSNFTGYASKEVEPIFTGQWYLPDSERNSFGIRFSAGRLIDSAAYLGDLYYRDFDVLTKPDSSLMAVWVETGQYYEESFYQSTLNKLTQLYGKPTYDYDTENEWGTRYWIWELPDRVIQFEISSGWSMSSDPNDHNGTYYDSEVVIVKREYVKQIATQLASSNFQLFHLYAKTIAESK